MVAPVNATPPQHTLDPAIVAVGPDLTATDILQRIAEWGKDDIRRWLSGDWSQPLSNPSDEHRKA